MSHGADDELDARLLVLLDQEAGRRDAVLGESRCHRGSRVLDLVRSQTHADRADVGLVHDAGAEGLEDDGAFESLGGHGRLDAVRHGDTSGHRGPEVA